MEHCHPNAVRFVKYYLTITHTRWEQVGAACCSLVCDYILLLPFHYQILMCAKVNIV